MPVQGFVPENDDIFYKVDFANIGVPVYMNKSGKHYPYRWYVSTAFYLYDEKQDKILELESLGNFGKGAYSPVQLWFKEIDGKVFTFRIYHISGYDYVLNVILVEGDKITQVRNDFFVPDKGRFVLTEGKIFTNDI